MSDKLQNPEDAAWQVREDARQVQFRKQFALTQAVDLAKEVIRTGAGMDSDKIVTMARVFDALLSETA